MELNGRVALRHQRRAHERRRVASKIRAIADPFRQNPRHRRPRSSMQSPTPRRNGSKGYRPRSQVDRSRHSKQKLMRRRRPEDLAQRAVVAHLKARPAKDLYWFAIPNGGYRSAVEAKILKGTGVRPGTPDLGFVHNGKPFFLELKAEGGHPSELQRAPSPKSTRPAASRRSPTASIRRSMPGTMGPFKRLLQHTCTPRADRRGQLHAAVHPTRLSAV